MNLKVVILVPCLGYGGAERQISLIAPRLVDKGFLVTIISMIPPVAYSDEMKSAGIDVITLDMAKGKYTLTAFFKLVSFLRVYHCKHIITFNYPANFMGRIMKLLFPRIKLITSIRSSTFGSPARERIIKLTKLLDLWTVPNSENTARYFVEKGIIDKKKLNIIKNGIIIPESNVIEDLNSKGKLLRKEFMNNDDDFLWIAVGRFDPPKDYPTLIEAFAILNSKTQMKWKLIILGEGSLKDEIQKQILLHGLKEHIILLGKIDNVMPYYFAADAFVSSSAWEGMPNAMVEAMLAGLPVIATDVGEVSKLVDENQGFVVKAKTPEFLATAMLDAMNMKSNELKKMGLNSTKFVKENFNIDTIIIKWVELLK